MLELITSCDARIVLFGAILYICDKVSSLVFFCIFVLSTWYVSGPRWKVLTLQWQRLRTMVKRTFPFILYFSYIR